MRSPSQILWEDAGHPDPAKSTTDMDTLCCVCGTHYHTGFDRNGGWSIPKNDTSQELFRAPNSAMICTPCVWVSKGRWKDQFRLWSPCYSEGGGLPDHYAAVYDQFGVDEDGEPVCSYHVRLKDIVEGGEDRVYIGCRGSLWPHTSLMLDPPEGRWFAVVSESGKKNLIRHASANRGLGRWRVQFELTEITSTPLEMAGIMLAVCGLRELGCSKQSILDARPNPYQIVKLVEKYGTRAAGLAEELLLTLSRYARSRILELALYLEHEEYRHDIIKKARQAIHRVDENRGGAARESSARLDTARRAQEALAEVLGLGAEGSEGGGGKGDGLRPDGIGDDPRTPDPRSSSEEGGQLHLFDA